MIKIFGGQLLLFIFLIVCFNVFGAEPAGMNLSEKEVLQNSAGGSDSQPQVVKRHRESFCDTPNWSDGIMVTMEFRLKKPLKNNFCALKKYVAAKKIPVNSWNCYKDGEIDIEISGKEARMLFPNHVKFGCGKGRGNSLDTDAIFVDVDPRGYIPKELKPLVRALTIDDDPKSEILKGSTYENDGKDCEPCP
jgi:hypothetical protein